MGKFIIECRDLCAGFDGQDVLSDISLNIARGLLIPFTGPNGGGKTTLLRIFLGLCNYRSGTLKCRFGFASPAYVPQQKAIDPLYPVPARAIAAMGLYPELGALGRPNREQKQRLDLALERFGLTRHQHKKFSELSGGMRQKILLARALVSRAEVLVLDEPTAGLDAESERDVLKHLIEINRNEYKTILMAHHRLEDLSHLSDRVCLVDNGAARMCSASQAWLTTTEAKT